MRQACKNILYTTANSRAYATDSKAGMPAWQKILYGIIAGIVLLCALWEFLMIRKYRKVKKAAQ